MSSCIGNKLSNYNVRILCDIRVEYYVANALFKVAHNTARSVK